MNRNKDLMLEMAKSTSDISIDGIVEAAKAAMCDTRCKMPDQYGSGESDVAWETMIKEVCDNCPLNAL